MEPNGLQSREAIVVFGNSIPPDYQTYCNQAGLTPRLAMDFNAAELAENSFFDIISLDDLTQAAMESCRARLGISHRAVAPLEILADKLCAKRQRAIAMVSPDWIEIPLPASGSAAAAMVEQSIGFPCVIKPSNGLYSAGVFRADTPTDIITAWMQVLTVMRSMKRKRGFGTVIAERFVPGAEFMIDGFRYQGEVFHLVYHQKWPELSGPTFHEIACISRGIEADELSKEQTAISDILEDLGLDNTPFHAEFRRAPSGESYLLELAPRLGGGGTSSSEMLRIATGLCAYGILHAVNRRCLTEEMVRPIARRWAMEYDFFVRRSGRLQNLAQAVDFCRKMGAQHVFCYAEEGDYIHEPPMNTASFLTAFFEVNSYEHAIQTIEELTRLSPIATS